MNNGNNTTADIELIKNKARWVWRQTLMIHGRAPETRIASSLSPIEVLTVLFYGGFLRFDPANLSWEKRDRFIVSKGHGAISLYAILSDLGFFSSKELDSVCKTGSFLGGIPDPIVPGFETVNGSLGHGPGVGCGMALGLKRKQSDNRVFVVTGDGELHEGAVWEAIMFAGHHKLNNMIMIVDNNTKCMLGETENVINLFPLAPKFESFGWFVKEVPGHDVAAVFAGLEECCGSSIMRPRVLIANTIKGHGVPSLENDPICHVKSLGQNEINKLLGE